MVRKFFLLVFMISTLSLNLTACSDLGGNPEADLVGKWEYVSNEEGDSAYFHNLTFQQNGTLFIGEKNDSAEYVVIAPGRIKLSAIGLSNILKFDLEEDSLRLYFEDGYNLYKRVEIAVSELEVATEVPIPRVTSPTTTPTRQNIVDEIVDAISKDQKVITPENASKLEEIHRFGKGTIQDITFSPNGEQIAVATTIGIYFYDSQTLSEISFIETKSWISSLAYSPDGKAFASGSWDNEVQLWDVNSGAVKQTLKGHTNWVNSVAFSPDGGMLATGGDDQTIRIWDINQGKFSNMLEVDDCRVNALAFSPNGDALASGCGNGSIYIWNPNQGILQTLEGHNYDVYDLAFSPDGRTLASGSRDTTIRIWDITRGTLLQTIRGHTSSVGVIAYSPDGTMIASGSYEIHLWDATNGELLQTIKGHTNWVPAKGLAFSPDRKTLAVGFSDHTIQLIDFTNGNLLRVVEGDSGSVMDLRFVPDSNTLTSGYGNGAIRQWDIGNGTLLHKIRENSIPDNFRRIRCVAFSPDWQTFAAGTTGTAETAGLIYIWNTATGTLTHTIQGPIGSVAVLLFSPDGQVLVSSGDRDYKIRLWDKNTGEILDILNGDNYVIPLVYSSDGQILASGTRGSIHLWDVNSKNHLQAMELPNADDTIEKVITSLVFSPDDKMLASGGYDIRTWDVNSGELLNTILANQVWVRSLAFSPDGRLLAAGNDDGTVCLWDVANGQHLITLDAHNSNFGIFVTFSSDGLHLASGSSDGTVRLWGIP